MAEEGDDEDKTEEPSQKRLDEALERGDVVKSIEVSTLFGLGAITALVAWMSTNIGTGLLAPLSSVFDHAAEVSMDQAGLTAIYIQMAKTLAVVLIVPLAVFMLAGIAGNMIQHRIVWSMDPLIPKFSKVSPMEGFKRLFSLDSLVNLVKGIAKICVVGGAMWIAISPELPKLNGIVSTSPLGVLAVTQKLALKLMMAVMIVMAVIAAADYLYQRQRWLKRHRMSRHDMKEEFKQQEGNPEIKQKLRQLRMARSRKRMMAAVPSATVVVTNPTHFAVALKYDNGMRAPKCVAKGVDQIALKIREVATGASVPIIENPPLARALHAAVEIDEDIPEEHYKAVAEVVGYVMKLKRRRR